MILSWCYYKSSKHFLNKILNVVPHLESTFKKQNSDFKRKTNDNIMIQPWWLSGLEQVSNPNWHSLKNPVWIPLGTIKCHFQKYIQGPAWFAMFNMCNDDEIYMSRMVQLGMWGIRCYALGYVLKGYTCVKPYRRKWQGGDKYPYKVVRKMVPN